MHLKRKRYSLRLLQISRYFTTSISSAPFWNRYSRSEKKRRLHQRRVTPKHGRCVVTGSHRGLPGDKPEPHERRGKALSSKFFETSQTISRQTSLTRERISWVLNRYMGSAEMTFPPTYVNWALNAAGPSPHLRTAFWRSASVRRNISRYSSKEHPHGTISCSCTMDFFRLEKSKYSASYKNISTK